MHNRYWLPPSADEIDIGGGCFTGCSVESYANMQDLASMPPSPAVHVTIVTKETITTAKTTPTAHGQSYAGGGSTSGGGGVAGGGTGGASNRTRMTLKVSSGKAAAGEGLSFFIRLRALDASGTSRYQSSCVHFTLTAAYCSILIGCMQAVRHHNYAR